MTSEEATSEPSSAEPGITFRQYRDESDLPTVMGLIDNELSEPYSIFTYRYFLHNWPHLCYLAFDGDKAFGTVVCKMDMHREHSRGYLAMLVVDKTYRGKGVGSDLVKLAIQKMIEGGCEEVVLEAEVVNTGALRLYQNLGFVRDKRLHRYYLNGTDAYRLKLLLPLTEEQQEALAARQMQAEANFASLMQPGDQAGPQAAGAAASTSAAPAAAAAAGQQQHQPQQLHLGQQHQHQHQHQQQRQQALHEVLGHAAG